MNKLEVLDLIANPNIDWEEKFLDIPNIFWKDIEVVMHALECDAPYHMNKTFQFADHALKKDKKTVLEVLKKDAFAFEFVDKNLKKNKEVILYAIERSGLNIKYIDKSYKKDRQITLAAVKKDGRALEYADKIFKKDKEIVLEALKNSGAPYTLIKFIDKSLYHEITIKDLKWDLDVSISDVIDLKKYFK